MRSYLNSLLKKSCFIFRAWFPLSYCNGRCSKVILISTAADRASNKFAESEAGKSVLSSQLGKSYIDDTGFENFDSRYVYALHSVRRYMMDAGVTLVDKIDEADTIIEVAAGALSIDNTGFY